MASPRQQLDRSILVEYSQFVVQDHDGGHQALAVGIPGQPGTRVAGGRGGLWIRSHATDHHPAVRLQPWDDAPERPEGEWQHVGEAGFTTDGARLRLWSVTAEQGDGDLLLGGRGHFRARVFVRGADAAAELDEGEFGEGVEGWLIQMWRDDRQPLDPVPRLYPRP